MKNAYKVIAETIVRDTLVITLDRKRDIDDYGKRYLSVNGNKHLFQLTHSEDMFVTDKSESFINKEIHFV